MSQVMICDEMDSLNNTETEIQNLNNHNNGNNLKFYSAGLAYQHIFLDECHFGHWLRQIYSLTLHVVPFKLFFRQKNGLNMSHLLDSAFEVVDL